MKQNREESMPAEDVQAAEDLLAGAELMTGRTCPPLELDALHTLAHAAGAPGDGRKEE